MHQKPTNTLKLNQSIFSTLKRFQPTYMAYKPIKAIATKWHKIFNHARANTIKQFPKHIINTELTELTTKQVPLKIKYKACLLTKHTQQIS